MKQKLLVLDGNSILNRAFYGIRNLSTAASLPTNAVFGFMNILHKHMTAVGPTHLACAFDTRKPTFRHEAYDGYKANRKGMPEELAVQLPYAREAAAALGFTVIECPGYEADDILGTLARMGEEADMEIYLLTGDRDSLQLISDNTRVVLMKTKEDIVYDPAVFAEEYGITPGQFIDVKALMGDSSDNIPGVAGIGEKTALKLIQTLGTLDALYADAENRFGGSSPSVCKKLTEGRDSAYLSRDLATICKTAPLEVTLEALANEGVQAEALAKLCDTLEFSGMAKKFGVEVQKTEPPAAVLPEMQKIDMREFTVPEVPVAIALSENGFALCDGTHLWLAENADPAPILEHSFLCHDLKSLLRRSGKIACGRNCVYDTMLAAYLLDPGKGNYPLDKAAAVYGLTLSETPAAPETAWYIWQLYEATKPKLEEAGMWTLYTEIELPLAAVLASMEEIGFKLDTDGIFRYAKRLADAEVDLMDAIWMAAGHDFNINSPKQLGEVLFEELNLPSGRKTKTGYSTDAETLERLRPYHPIIENILSYRQISKLRGTYGEPLVRLADANGRIHTQLNQTGTATGRLSSNDPNLQNIPVRMELGRELRKYFIPENENYVLIDADYSQIELRLLAHLADDPVMQEAFIAETDIHTKVASQVFGIPEDQVTPELRRRAKAVNFGIIYGIGDYSLSQDLHISRKQAAQYIENYLATYPNVDSYLQGTIADAKDRGYTTTMFGRRRKIPELASKNRNLQAFGERVAMNSPLQGSAADIIKIAMIRVHHALAEAGIDARLIMQVHDELIVESAVECAETAKEILVREMETAAALKVPLTAEAGIGASWYEAK
ncbi:MAG: DNA polymerase I [Clostridia bacterium]|nr:DNA polymerase I [Clostridia bacterium]